MYASSLPIYERAEKSPSSEPLMSHRQNGHCRVAKAELMPVVRCLACEG
jgi:hypothetical protein